MTQRSGRGVGADRQTDGDQPVDVAELGGPGRDRRRPTRRHNQRRGGAVRGGGPGDCELRGDLAFEPLDLGQLLGRRALAQTAVNPGPPDPLADRLGGPDAQLVRDRHYRRPLRREFGSTSAPSAPPAPRSSCGYLFGRAISSFLLRRTSLRTRRGGSESRHRKPVGPRPFDVRMRHDGEPNDRPSTQPPRRRAYRHDRIVLGDQPASSVDNIRSDLRAGTRQDRTRLSTGRALTCHESAVLPIPQYRHARRSLLKHRREWRSWAGGCHLPASADTSLDGTSRGVVADHASARSFAACSSTVSSALGSASRRSSGIGSPLSTDLP